MSSIINKVKDALHHDKTDTTGTHTTTGAHTTGTHTTGTHTTGTHTTGTHTGTHGTHSGTAEGVAGPHNSRIANAADPRVDSDLDGSRNVGASTQSHSHANVGYGNTAPTGAGYGPGLVGSTGQSTHTSQPVHNSATLNKLDPRVDTVGNTHNTAGYGATGNTHNTTGYGATGTTGGISHVTPGTTGGISHSTNAGPHDSNIANKVDPRVDSDLDGRGNRTGADKGGVFGASGSHATAGSGTAQNTAGPHNSDLLNKIDPRVDSDRDGSGGSRTHA